ncbi:hypothetical protein [Corynebacterium kalidii]
MLAPGYEAVWEEVKSGLLAFLGTHGYAEVRNTDLNGPQRKEVRGEIIRRSRYYAGPFLSKAEVRQRCEVALETIKDAQLEELRFVALQYRLVLGTYTRLAERQQSAGPGFMVGIPPGIAHDREWARKHFVELLRLNDGRPDDSSII